MNINSSSWFNLFKVTWNFLEEDKLKFIIWIFIIGFLNLFSMALPPIISIIGDSFDSIIYEDNIL